MIKNTDLLSREWNKKVKKKLNIFLILSLIFIISSCVSARYPKPAPQDKPQNINNVCAIFAERPSWRPVVEEASKKWNTTVPTIMAIIHQESSFNSQARPFDPNGKPLSSAYGYSQALSGTWGHYQSKTGNTNGKRDNFSDAVDFVGWYIHTTARLNSVKPSRADLIYLNYHEGWGGFKAQTYRKKPWLLDVAKKVAARSKTFAEQLRSCGSVDSYILPRRSDNSQPSDQIKPKPKAHYEGDWF